MNNIAENARLPVASFGRFNSLKVRTQLAVINLLLNSLQNLVFCGSVIAVAAHIVLFLTV